jgi:cytochrome c biogenesis factor
MVGEYQSKSTAIKQKQFLNMKNTFQKIIATLFLFLSGTLHAQTTEVEMADAFRADGKIYVVVAMVLIILVGFFVYLILVDRKLSRIEKEQKSSTEKKK